MQPLIEKIAAANGLSVEYIYDAVEAACITSQEWEEDPVGCMARINGALEEIHYGEDYIG